MIAAQHLDYPAYLQRLRAKPVEELLQRESTSEYPHGLAAAVLLALDAVRAGDRTGGVRRGDGPGLGAVRGRGAAGGAARRRAGRCAGRAEQRRSRRAGLRAEVVDEALGRLAGSSLLTFSTGGGTVTAHRLVMRVIRERLARQGRLAAACQAAAAALQARAGSLEQAWQDRPARRDLVEQILAVHEHAAVFSGEDGSDLTLAVLRLRGWALWFLNELGDSAAQAIAVAEPLLADQERVLGPDHPDTLASRNDLALAYRAAGRVAEAIPLFERTLAESERVLGPDHPSTLTSRNNLAYAYHAAGRAAEAIALHERTLADYERVLGPDHPDTLGSRNNLALAYGTRAGPPRRSRCTSGPWPTGSGSWARTTPTPCNSRNNLALAYQDAGRAAEAIALHERTLADRERVLGPDHPDTLNSRNNLAAARAALG